MGVAGIPVPGLRSPGMMGLAEGSFSNSGTYLETEPLMPKMIHPVGRGGFPLPGSVDARNNIYIIPAQVESHQSQEQLAFSSDQYYIGPEVRSVV